MSRSDSQTDFQTGHVGINVTDLDRAVRFYESVFGFTVGGRSDQEARRFAFLKNGDTLALTLWQQSDGRFLYEGAVPHGEGASSGGIFFEDPDGTRLEIFTSDGLQHAHAPTTGAPSCGFF
jgi:catechol 2,3-dioxygenase-like lactoylglutathione lyase family enzyme